MASPISITPVLTNKDSIKFNKDLKQNLSNKLSKDEKERISNLVREVLEKNKKK